VACDSFAFCSMPPEPFPLGFPSFFFENRAALVRAAFFYADIPLSFPSRAPSSPFLLRVWCAVGPLACAHRVGWHTRSSPPASPTVVVPSFFHLKMDALSATFFVSEFSLVFFFSLAPYSCFAFLHLNSCFPFIPLLSYP